MFKNVSLPLFHNMAERKEFCRSETNDDRCEFRKKRARTARARMLSTHTM